MRLCSYIGTLSPLALVMECLPLTLWHKHLKEHQVTLRKVKAGGGDWLAGYNTPYQERHKELT